MENNLNMSLSELLKTRHSVRGFTPDLVPEETLKAIFETAQNSPSNCNTQPWKVYVASGAKCNELRENLVKHVASAATPDPDFLYFERYAKDLRQRQVTCAKTLYDCMGIERHDKPARSKAMFKNFEFFDAPHVAYICMPRHFEKLNITDIGIYLQTLMLTMHSHGVSSCAQGALTFYPKPARKLFDIDESLGVAIGLSFGYEDKSIPANKTRTTREPIEKIVTFLS